MKLPYIFFLSLASIKTRKLRSILTISGITIGIALVLFLVSLGVGLQKIATDSIASAESLTNIEVSRGEATLLDMSDKTVTTFKDVDCVSGVSYRVDISAKASLINQASEIALYAVSEDYLSHEGIEDKLVNSNVERPVIVSDQLINSLGLSSTSDAIGKEIDLIALIPTQTDLGVQLKQVEESFTIVDVISEQEGVVLAYVSLDEFSDIYLEYDLIRLNADSEDNVQSIKLAIRDLGYQAESVQDTISEINRIFVIVQLVIIVIGAISIVVAAIGALNTLTVSLLERTREIGLLKALGSERRSVYVLFLVESLLIGVVGGILGIFVGWGAGAIVNTVLGYLAKVNGELATAVFITPWWFVVAILALVVITSIITGMYPAFRASRINVLDALRRE